MGSRAGDGSGPPPGVKPGALTDLLRQVAATPDEREAEPPPLLAGTLVGRFEIQRELGRGAFGVVYEARDRDLGRQVALKLVRPGAAALEDGKVSREAEAIARLAHPNLVTLHEVGRCDSGPYLVFELLRGKTLQERIDDGPLPLQEAVHLAVEVARGLAHAHAEGVVHRDLKPANVFVTVRGQVKILDFGMAHAFGRRRLSGGTPAYMAPEQWDDDPEDERTDVFALGVMLYRMLSGEYPFPEREGRWTAESATAPRLDVPGAPGLAELLEAMLDWTPKGRPRDGAAVLSALAPIEEALRARPADGAPQAQATKRKATLGDLLAEMRRRRVFRVMVGYGIFAFAALQVSEPIMHGAHLPDWILTAVLVALGLGFPVAVILGWIFDLTAHGVRRTPSVAASAAVFFSRSRLVVLLVGVALIAAIPGAAWYLWKQPGARGQDAAGPGGTPSIAVLPFADMSPGRDQEYMADGIAEEILNSLAQVEGLRVSGRTSSFSFKGTRRTIAEIGRELNVWAILEGSVRKAGGRIRITAQLVKTADEFHLWSRTFDRDLVDVFAVQDEIARAVVEALRLRLLPGQALAQGGTRNQEAYEQFLLARDLHAIRSQASVERAVQASERALDLDPRYAQAWAELAAALSFLESSYDVRPSPERRRRIEHAEERALELAPDLTEAYLTRGERRLLRLQDWTGAQADLGRARELSPGSSGVMYLHGRTLLVLGQVKEAVAALEAATVADPLSAMAFIFLGQAYLSAGEATRAEAALARALQIAPRSDSARYYLMALLITQGRPGEALLLAKQADVKWVRFTGVSLAQHSLGRAPESQAALEALVAESAETAPYQIAEVHAWRGEADRTFEWLERARQEADPGLSWIKTDPLLGKIRGDRRYSALLRKMNLPVD